VADVFNGTPSGELLNFSSHPFDVVVNGLGGDDTIQGNNFSPDLSDTLNGGAGNDVISDFQGDDVVNGNDGADRLRPGEGSDVYDGGRGADTLDFNDSSADWNVDLLQKRAVNSQAVGDIDTILRIECVLGGFGEDTIVGTRLAEMLVGGGGEDRLLGAGGGDSLDGGLLADLLLGGIGHDTLRGGDGDSFNDTLQGQGGDDLIEGGGGQDRLVGGGGSDTMAGDVGNDNLRGGAGADVLVGGAGRDILLGGAGADTFSLSLPSDSNGAQRDLVQDFSVGADRINLSEIDADVSTAGDQAFVFRPNGKFTGAGAEVRAKITDAGRTLVQADIDGDRATDFELVLSGAISLSGADFLL